MVCSINDQPHRPAAPSQLNRKTLGSAEINVDISLPGRVNVVALLLGAALAAMGVSVAGAPLGLAVLPLMRVLEIRVNPLVSPAATLLNCLTVWLVLLALRWAVARGKRWPTSIWARNDAVLAAARVVAVVYLAQLVVRFAASEIRWFFDVPVFNATQLRVRSFQGGVFMAVVLPMIGVVLLLAVGPRILASQTRDAA